jgi:hypothetical protein
MPSTRDENIRDGCAEENPKKKEHATTVEVHYYYIYC